MSSCTKTRRNLFPLCTSKVCPTNSGMIVHARAQVLRGCLARFSFSFETFLKSFSSTYGPFLALLLISQLVTGGAAHAPLNKLNAHRLRALLVRTEFTSP